MSLGNWEGCKDVDSKVRRTALHLYHTSYERWLVVEYYPVFTGYLLNPPTGGFFIYKFPSAIINRGRLLK